MPMLTTDVRAHTIISPATGKPIGPEFDGSGNPVYWKGNLGNYIDLGYTHKFSKEIILKAGFSYATISDMKNQMVYGYQNVPSKQLFGLGSNFFGWTMLIVKPNFFTSGKK